MPSVFTFVESWQLIASGIRTKETDELCPFASKMTLENATFGGQIFCKTPKMRKMAVRHKRIIASVNLALPTLIK